MTQLHLVDLYELLGVSEDASLKEIRSAYRVKIREIHPDHPGSTEDDLVAARTLNAAKELLCDPIRRSRYDLKRRLRQIERATTALARMRYEPSAPPPPVDDLDPPTADDPAPPPTASSPSMPTSTGEVILATSIVAAGFLGLGALLLTQVRPRKARC